MIDQTVNKPVPAMDLDGYVEIVVQKTGEIEGHEYRRGSRHTVDAVILKAMREGGLVPVED